MSARQHFSLDWTQAHLNHGSFGAVPVPVAASQSAVRQRLEQNPHRFIRCELEGELHAATVALSRLHRAEPAGMALVSSVSEGAATVAAAVPLKPGDEVVLGQHEYPALADLWRRRCAAAGADLVRVPLPVRSASTWGDRLADAVTARTRALFVSHVVSAAAVRIDLAPVRAATRGHGALLIVDGAHGPGQIPVDLGDTRVDVYLGSLHKWRMHPRGSAFLWAAASVRDVLRPLAHSWYFDEPELWRRLGWQGTRDLTGWLVGDTVEQFHQLAALEGWASRARELSRSAEDLLQVRLDLDPVGGAARAPSMFSVVLPGADAREVSTRLRAEGVWTWVGTLGDDTALRVSTTYYNDEDDVDRLVASLERVLRG